MKRATALAKKAVIGHGVAEGTTQGPQVDPEQFHKILNYIDIGKKQGAKLMCGGESFRLLASKPN